MKKKAFAIVQILCIVLAAALVLSIVALVSAKSDVAALTDQVHALESQNQVLRSQMSLTDTEIQTDLSDIDVEGYHCSLMIESWSVESGTLTVNAFAQAYLPGCTKTNAHLELWFGESILESTPILLDIGEADGAFEADVENASFVIPEIGPDEELQLWLKVEPMNNEPIFANGASWYFDDGQLMLMAG